MIKKIRKYTGIFFVLALFVCLCMSFNTVAFAATEDVEIVDKENLIEYEDANGQTQVGFDIVGNYNGQQNVQVKVIEESGGKDPGYIIYIVIGAAVVVAAGVVIAIVLIRKKKKGKGIMAAALFLLLGLYTPFSTAYAEKIYTGGDYGYPEAVHSENTDPAHIEEMAENIVTKRILSDYEHGVELRYDRIYNTFKRYWTDNAPEYSYAPISVAPEDLQYKTTEGEEDNCNYWMVYPAEDKSTDGVVSATYRVDYGGYGNFIDASLYNKFRIVYRGTNAKGKTVNLTVKVVTDTEESGRQTYTLGTYQGRSGQKVILTFDTTVIPDAERFAVSRIIYETSVADIPYQASGSSYQKNELYYADFYSTEKASITQKLDGVQFHSEYLGTMVTSLYGLYSGSCMYDEEAGLWRWWGGGGIPEGVASDNIWYLETPDPAYGWSIQKRIIINDENGILHSATASPGQAGDPTVIKVDGVYYMYFTALPAETSDGTWNKVYLATSTDGYNFDLYEEPIIDCPVSDSLYGAGAPCVIYKDDMFYLYYFNTQTYGACRATSTDGYVFEAETKVNKGHAGMPAAVTYIESIEKWVFFDGMLGFSDDGINFTYPSDGNVQGQESSLSDPVMNWSRFTDENGKWVKRSNHSGNFFTDSHGMGYDTMFIAYAFEDLVDVRNGLNMDFRELEWSVISFSKVA